MFATALSSTWRRFNHSSLFINGRKCEGQLTFNWLSQAIVGLLDKVAAYTV